MTALQREKKHTLTLEQTLELKALSANLKSTFAEENFFSNPVELPPNVLDHPVMQNFIQRIQHEKNNTIVESIINHEMLASRVEDWSMRKTEVDDELSVAAQAILSELSHGVNTRLDEFFSQSDTLNFDRETLTAELIAVISDIEQTVATSEELTDTEAQALLASCVVQRELITDIVNNAENIFNNTAANGRTNGFFKKLGRYIGSVVVSAAAGAVVGGIIGAVVTIGQAGAGAVNGAAIGAAAGAVIGIYQATQNKCADSWDFQSRVPFVHWVDC